MRQVVFLTRIDCQLCDDALHRVQRVSRLLRRRLVVKEIAGNPELDSTYHDRVPVLLDGSGRVLAEGALGLSEVLRAIWRS